MLRPEQESQGLLAVEADSSGFALHRQQRALEDHCLGAGGLRFRQAVAKALEAGESSRVGAARKLLRLVIDPLEKGIIELLSTKKRGRRHMAVRLLEHVDPGAAAYITAQAAINHAMRQPSLKNLSVLIAQMLLDEARWRRFEKARPGLFNYRTKKLPGDHYDHNRRVMNASVNWAVANPREDDPELDLSDLHFTEQEKVLIGGKMLDLLAATSGIIHVVSHKTRNAQRRGVETRLYVELTPEARQWLQKKNEVLEFHLPFFLPMVETPLPWGPGQKGGYRYALRGRHPLVKKGKQSAAILAEAHMPIVYRALNTLQETAWKINQPVYALLQTLAFRKEPFGKLVVADLSPEKIPPKPADIGTNDEAKARWKRAAKATHERNHARVSQRASVVNALDTAKRFVDAERFYYPYNLDFRGRIYPIPASLSPQGPDEHKALLTFAEAKPLGPDGAYWLAVHGANCLDETPDGRKVKTMTMQERVSWIQQHTPEILRVANDPLESDWWTCADKPLQFYAFCVEWRNWYEMYKIGKGDEYVCGLPVSQDGSCNGLQHFSALLRDEVGGRATNLVPLEQPQDVYDHVASKVLAVVEQGAAQGEIIAQQWLRSGLVGRKLCKRPTMTYTYGSKPYGMADQTIAFLQADKDEWQKLKGVFGDEAPKAAQWMAKVIWGALGESVKAASEAMQWLQSCAELIAKENKAVSWLVPGTRFPVTQMYYHSESREVATVLLGKLYRPTTYRKLDTVLQHKQINAIAPNFVHSLDASALMLTVLISSQRGVGSFGMVHDSYATVPADCGTLADATRDAFVHLYRDYDIIAHMEDQFRSQLPDGVELPKAPEPGALQIEQVKDSTYFFN